MSVSCWNKTLVEKQKFSKSYKTNRTSVISETQKLKNVQNVSETTTMTKKNKNASNSTGYAEQSTRKMEIASAATKIIN